MRVLGYLAICLAVAAFAVSAARSWALLDAVPVAPDLTPADVARTAPAVPVTLTGPRDWPALFGTPEPVEPQPPAPPTPPVQADAMPAAPPLDALGYALRGTVTVGDIEWAILSHPTGERIVKIGDTVEEGIVVTGISPLGMQVRSARGREVLKFAD